MEYSGGYESNRIILFETFSCQDGRKVEVLPTARMTVIQIMLLLIGCTMSTSGQCFKDINDVPSRQKLLLGMEDFFSASKYFSIKLLHALNTTKDTFFSPFSVWSSLISLYLGSQGSTEKELEAVLHLQGMDKNQVAHSYHSLKYWFSSKIRTHSSSRTTFSMVNNLFFQKDIKIRNCLLQFISEDLVYVDFKRHPELSRVAINFLVRRETRDKIPEILPPNSVQVLTELIVTSTMYFKGVWLQPFSPQLTKPGLFSISRSEFVLAEMMVVRDIFQYSISDELQCTAVELPYLGGSLTMVVMLPNNKAHGVQILTSSLTVPRLNNLTEDMFPRDIVLAMPKFKMEDSFQLSSTLLKIGLRDLVTGSSDLRGFSSDSQLLELNAMFHKAKISVDERGTEASAGTATAFPRRAKSNKTLEFIVDRPFLFFIRENHSGSILFVGVVRKPLFKNLIRYVK